MKVLRARVLGFCMGVRRAMDMAGSEARVFQGASGIFTVGPLIHNPQALEALSAQGISVLDEGAIPRSLEGSVLIVRAHGITPDLEDDLKKRGGRLVDATCPHVRSSQMKAKQLAEAGYHIFLAGERRHGEIIGIQGYAEKGRGASCTIVAGVEEAEEEARLLHEREGDISCALLAQTTISPEEYEKIGSAIRNYFPALMAVNTICGATRDRQEALRELCARAQAVIIAGGRESANTRRLLAIARNSGVPAWLVETQADLPPEIWNYAVVGLSAGASTPDSIILDIERVLTGPPDSPQGIR